MKTLLRTVFLALTLVGAYQAVFGSTSTMPMPYPRPTLPGGGCTISGGK